MSNKFLCLLLGLACLGGEVYATGQNQENKREKLASYAPAAEVDVWIDHAAEEYAGGDGTEQSPYQIKTAAQFAKIAKEMFYDTSKSFENTWFVIENDLDLSGYQWFPIGFTAEEAKLGKAPFGGKVDGQGHKITNLDLPGFSGFAAMGLFGYTSKTFELKNLTIQSGNANGEIQVGSFVGYNAGLVENCVNYVDVTCLMYYAGGITGSTGSTGKISKCQNFGSIQAGHNDTQGLSGGGITGSSSSTIEQCINWGDVTARTNGAGGIVAIMEGGKLSQCINRGDIKVSTEQAGGIVASVLGRTSACEISNCYSACKITTDSKTAIGGVLGVGIMNYPYNFTIANNYFDYELYNGNPIGDIHDNFGKTSATNNTPMTTANMKSADFIATLNNESEGNAVWIEDTNNINDGYPILEFVKDFIPSGIAETAVEDNVQVIAMNNSIQLTGLDSTAGAEVYSINGMRLYYGNVSELASAYFNNGIYLVKANNKVYKVCIR